ncbi:MAG: organic hydroperoxide resistance protein [Segniliparus sp.]|uniref:organic hydroperoxide resistance protein n=1 Tax=Segniliparus sp. TaxID=2804064 RepID=UPI003F405498
MPMSTLYTTSSTASGGGRDGHVKSSDGRLDLDTKPPKELGGSGEGTNPEQLFSAGYAACFLGALRLVASQSHVQIPAETAVTATVGIGKDQDGGFLLSAAIEGRLPGLDQAVADDLVDQAHDVCPYSNATRGNIEVALSARV